MDGWMGWVGWLSLYDGLLRAPTVLIRLLLTSSSHFNSGCKFTFFTRFSWECVGTATDSELWDGNAIYTYSLV